MVTTQDLEEIWQWNNTVPEPVERCVHEMIEERAQAQPNAPAVCAWDGELTYGELNQLATKLAGRLVRPWCRSGRAGAPVFREVNVDDGCHACCAQGRRSLRASRPLPSRATSPGHSPTSQSKPGPLFSLQSGSQFAAGAMRWLLSAQVSSQTWVIKQFSTYPAAALRLSCM